MTVYYVDPDATGDNDGGGDGTDRTDPTEAANWTHAWTDIQTAFDSVSPGDITYCRNTQDCDTTVDIDRSAVFTDTASASATRFIGCDSDGNPGAGRFHMSFGNNAVNGLYITGVFKIYIEHFEISSTATDAGTLDGLIGSVASGNARGNVFLNCYFHGWQNYCANAYDGLQYSSFIRCKFSDSQTAVGLRTRYNQVLWCTLDNNANTGGYHASQGHWMGCVSHSNGEHGFHANGGGTILNCVSHGNGHDGLYVVSGNFFNLIGTRLTNNVGYGLNTTGRPIQTIGCYIQGNGDGDVAPADEFQLEHEYGETTSVTGGTDPGYGYNSGNLHDYNLRSDATNRGVAIELNTE